MPYFVFIPWFFSACLSPAKVTLGNDDSATGTNDIGCSPVTEVCNEVDDDCDGEIDEDATDAQAWYPDRDGDGYGDPSFPTTSCTQPAGYVNDATDCNDGDASVNPGAVEACDDGIDNDCQPGNEETGSTETCDGIDNDCDGTVDDGVTTTYYRDADGDGYGTGSSWTSACSAPSGYVSDWTDCDDGDADVNPDSYEAYYDITSPGSGVLYCEDGVDNDCDGNVDSADTECADEDADGIPDRVDYLFVCDPDGDGVNEAACLRSDMLWVSPWDSVDCIQQMDDFTTLSTNDQNTLVSVTWGGETFEVCPIYPTSVSTAIDARAVSSLGTDGVSVVDTSNCGDWLPADLENYCEDWLDNLCTTKTSSDGCETVGKVISFAYDGTRVTP